MPFVNLRRRFAQQAHLKTAEMIDPREGHRLLGAVDACSATFVATENVMGYRVLLD
jgi:hypothetical protein